MITVAVIILFLTLPVLAGYVIYSIFMSSRRALHPSKSTAEAPWAFMPEGGMMQLSTEQVVHPSLDCSAAHQPHHGPCDHHQHHHSHVDTTSHSVDSNMGCGCDTSSSSGCDTSSN